MDRYQLYVAVFREATLVSACTATGKDPPQSAKRSTAPSLGTCREARWINTREKNLSWLVATCNHEKGEVITTYTKTYWVPFPTFPSFLNLCFNTRSKMCEIHTFFHGPKMCWGLQKSVQEDWWWWGAESLWLINPTPLKPPPKAPTPQPPQNPYPLWPWKSC